MANYPTLPWSDRSEFKSRGGISTETADDGVIRSRVMYGSTNYDYTLLHDYITTADRATLLAHYAANKSITFNVVTPWGETYLMRYLDQPESMPHVNGQWTMTTRLTGKLV